MSAIKSLRAFYKDRLAIPDMAALQTELMGGTDRGVVITLGAFLDDALEFAIAGNLRRGTKEQYEYAFRNDGPLGTFSARIEMAYLLHIIEAPRRDQLTDIREMRNACAHSKLTISFETTQLANVCKRVFKNGRFKPASDSARHLKSAFTAECFFIFAVLVNGPEEAERRLKEAYAKNGMEPP